MMGACARAGILAKSLFIRKTIATVRFAESKQS
jgi:hypothetical protein